MMLVVPEKMDVSRINNIDHNSFCMGFNAAIDKIIELNKSANPNGLLVYEGVIKHDGVK